MRSRSLQTNLKDKRILEKFRVENLFKELLMVFFISLSLFILISLFTFNSEDPSSYFFTKNNPQNACGLVGAWLSAHLLNWFGIGSFLFPAAFLFLGVTLHNKEGWNRFLSVFSGMAICVMSLTLFLTLLKSEWTYSGSRFVMGGALGLWASTLLAKYLNTVGAQIVSLSVFLSAFSYSVPFSIVRFSLYSTQKLGVFLFYFLSFLTLKLTVFLYGFTKKLLKSQKLYSSAMQWKSDFKETLQHIFKRNQNEEHKQILDVPSETLETVQPLQESPVDFEVQEIEDEMGSETDTIDMTELRKKNRAPVILEATQEELFNEDEATSLPKKSLKKNILNKQGNWKLPSLEFLRKPPKVESSINKEKLLENSKILEQKFLDFGIDGEVTAVRPGPVITLYEFKPGPGVKVSRIAALSDDLSMALSAESVRILAPLPGKAVVGIEIPSDQREKVFFREFLQNDHFYGEQRQIPVVMGKDIGGATIFSDLAKMPHLLCAGQTGSGKSVFMNGLICSLLYRFTPEHMRMILVDPKFIEFRSYQDIPHLLLPVVDDSKHASNALKWAVREMERRYRILAKMGVRNLASYNQKVDEMGIEVVTDLLFEEDESTDSQKNLKVSGCDWAESFEKNEEGQAQVGKLPYIVIIIDELADLMMIAKKEVEISIARISQKARAAGIHLVIATQRPSTDVITGLIKANLPSRVSFQLASYIDSKTILDRAGAERLLGQGDMLFIPPGTSQLLRLHGAYVDDEEINKITQFLRSQGEPVYRQEIIVDEEEDATDAFADENLDALFSDGVDLIKKSGHASASFLQRHLGIGYNRAAKMIEVMEEKGIVGPSQGNAKSREVLLR